MGRPCAVPYDNCVGATPCGRPLYANEQKPRALDDVRGFCVQMLDSFLEAVLKFVGFIVSCCYVPCHVAYLGCEGAFYRCLSVFIGGCFWF